MIATRNQNNIDNMNQPTRFSQPNFPCQNYEKYKKQEQYFLGQTTCIGLYFMIRQVHLPEKNANAFIILRKNGYPVDLPPMISKTVIQRINSITKSSPFCQYTSKGQIVFYLKVIKSSDEKLFQKYKEKTQSVILNVVTSVMEFYGIVPNNTKIGKGKGTICMLKNALQATKKVIQINHKDYPQTVTDQQRIKLQQMQKCNREKKRIHREIVDINCCDMNSLTNLNKSKKFCLQKGKYNLKLKDQSSDGNLEEEINIQLLKKEVISQGDEVIKSKLQRQIKIIKQINLNPEYFVQYFFLSEEKPEMFYMNFIPSNLSFWITNNFITVEDSTLFFRQLLLGVQSLHYSGVIHRDLKPENILVDTSANSCIKIIDFSDSALKSQQYSVQLSNSLGSSLPYSPFQCAYNCQFGVKSESIDIWSLGVILHELVYKQMPSIYYNSVTREQFREGISKSQFSIQILKRYKHIGFLGLLQKIVHIILCKCLRMKHRQRISLKGLIRIGDEINNMMENFSIDMEKFTQKLKKVNNNCK